MFSNYCCHFFFFCSVIHSLVLNFFSMFSIVVVAVVVVLWIQYKRQLNYILIANYGKYKRTICEDFVSMEMDSDGTNTDDGDGDGDGDDDDVNKNDYGYSTHALSIHTHIHIAAQILNHINMHKYSSGV